MQIGMKVCFFQANYTKYFLWLKFGQKKATEAAFFITY